MLREDHFFLNQNLSLFPDQRKKEIRNEYKNRFLAGMDAEPSEIRKANAGRFAANSYLRELVKKEGDQ